VVSIKLQPYIHPAKSLGYSLHTKLDEMGPTVILDIMVKEERNSNTYRTSDFGQPVRSLLLSLFGVQNKTHRPKSTNSSFDEWYSNGTGTVCSSQNRVTGFFSRKDGKGKFDPMLK